MAKQLKKYKRKEVACIIVEDFETGNVFKIVGEENIKKAENKYTENEITYIYNPTQEQRKEILGLFETKQEDNKIISAMGDYDMLTKMFPLLTDIQVDIESNEDIEIIKENIKDPDKVFSKVLIELNNILLDINLEWIESLKIVGKVPQEIVDIISEKELGE